MATAAADAGERVAGEQAFDAVKWFSQRYLHGHQTRANYFWLDRDTVQKFVDNNICNVDRATNLTAADLDHFGVPLSKREALLRELSTLGCNSGPSSARLSGKGCHPVASIVQRNRSAAVFADYSCRAAVHSVHWSVCFLLLYSCWL